MLPIAFLLVAIIALAGIVHLNHKERKTIMAKLSSLAGQVTAIETVLNKVLVEVKALKDSLGDVDIPDEAQAALDRLSALATQIDNENPDVEPQA